MRHYSELELLDAVYLADDPETTRHLDSCAACRGRLERLRADLGSIREEFDARVDHKPEAFWNNQRAAILARVAPRPERAARPFRAFALAATLMIAVAGAWIVTDRTRDPRAIQPAPVTSTAAATPAELAPVALPTADPWASDELAGWESAVDWESWLEPAALEQGGA